MLLEAEENEHPTALPPPKRSGNPAYLTGLRERENGEAKATRLGTDEDDLSLSEPKISFLLLPSSTSSGLAAVLGAKDNPPLESHEILQKATAMGWTQK